MFVANQIDTIYSLINQIEPMKLLHFFHQQAIKKC
jgi:hypothetical protein